MGKEEKQNEKNGMGWGKVQTLAISTDFCKAARRLLMIRGSPGGGISFFAPFLMALNIGVGEVAVAGETTQSMYTSTCVSPLSSTVINPSLAPPRILSTFRGTGRGRLAPWQRLLAHCKLQNVKI